MIKYLLILYLLILLGILSLNLLQARKLSDIESQLQEFQLYEVSY